MIDDRLVQAGILHVFVHFFKLCLYRLVEVYFAGLSGFSFLPVEVVPVQYVFPCEAEHVGTSQLTAVGQSAEHFPDVQSFFVQAFEQPVIFALRQVVCRC